MRLVIDLVSTGEIDRLPTTSVANFAELDARLPLFAVDASGASAPARVRSALKVPGTVVGLVFNFVDLMTHGRSESPILMEVAKDSASLRDLTRSWFERSTAFFASLLDAADPKLGSKDVTVVAALEEILPRIPELVGDQPEVEAHVRTVVDHQADRGVTSDHRHHRRVV